MRLISDSPWMTIVAKANEEVEIDIEGIIGGDWWDADDEAKTNTKEKLRAELKAMAELKAKHIIVNINSYGGDVNHGISMYELLVNNKAKVTTRVQGFTASIATVIAMAGDVREMSSNALFLIHKPMFMMFGSFNENSLDEYKEQLVKVGERINAIYTKAGVKQATVDELMEAGGGYGKWIDADEAKDYGFVNTVYEPLQMAAIHNPDLLDKMNISKLPQNYTDMQDTSKLKSMFEDLKNWMAEKGIIPASVEMDGDTVTVDSGDPTVTAEQGTIMVAPEELNKRLTAMQEAIAVFEKDEQALAELATLKQAHDELKAKQQTLEAENASQKEKLVKMEAELTKKNGQGTNVGGPEGAEDPDGEVNNPEKKMLLADLAKLRNELTVTHT